MYFRCHRSCACTRTSTVTARLRSRPMKSWSEGRRRRRTVCRWAVIQNRMCTWPLLKFQQWNVFMTWWLLQWHSVGCCILRLNLGHNKKKPAYPSYFPSFGLPNRITHYPKEYYFLQIKGMINIVITKWGNANSNMLLYNYVWVRLNQWPVTRTFVCPFIWEIYRRCFHLKYFSHKISFSLKMFFF